MTEGNISGDFYFSSHLRNFSQHSRKLADAIGFVGRRVNKC